ncbi:MAG TPA: prepilin peptidase [Patescibacteria group bacterium]|nr:prepilin peptidase [Patescibacteria group bacterium]
MHSVVFVIPWVILLFVLGLCVGSFLNVVIYRLPKGESLLGRSYCDNCKKKLSWLELIPLVSYLFLKGRCRSCNKRIDSSIPTVELVTALIFTSLILKFPIISWYGFLYLLFIFSSFVAIFFIDLKKGIIPDKIVYPAIILTLIYSFFNQTIIENLAAGLASSLFFFLLYIGTRGKGMGFGDVKLALLLGLFLGFPKILFSLYIAFLTGGIYSLILILWRKKRWHGDSVAFGPFLILGAILSFFLGERLVSLLSNYLSL